MNSLKINKIQGRGVFLSREKSIGTTCIPRVENKVVIERYNNPYGRIRG
jgi:hypothetical protein